MVEIFLEKSFQQKITFSQNPEFTCRKFLFPLKILTLQENQKWAALVAPFQERVNFTFSLEERKET